MHVAPVADSGLARYRRIHAVMGRSISFFKISATPIIPVAAIPVFCLCFYPLKFLTKGSVGVSRYCRFLVPPTIFGARNATNFKLCMHFNTIDRNKSPLTISGNVAVTVARDSRKFPRHPYIGRISDMGRIARLSLRSHGFLALHCCIDLVARVFRMEVEITLNWSRYTEDYWIPLNIRWPDHVTKHLPMIPLTQGHNLSTTLLIICRI